MKCATGITLLFILVGLTASGPLSQPTTGDALLLIEQDDVEALGNLLARGLDPNADFMGLTLLMHAASFGKPECIAELLDAGADVDRITDCNATALTWAAHTGNAESVRRLLEAGANVNAKMTTGGTPLMLAVLSGDAHKVAVILAAGADVHARTEHGTTASDGAEAAGHDKVAHLLRRAARRSNPR